MSRKTKIFILAALVLFTTATFALSQIDRKDVDDLYSKIELFSYALTTIQSEYVEKQDAKNLIYGSLRGMLASLDPHSQFLDPEEYTELKTETQGKFGGLGIEISIRDGLLTVITPIEGTPAWKAGIKAGDRIVKIEDQLTKDLTLGDAVKKLRGKPGSEVNITVLREDEFKLHEFKIVREIITIEDVKDATLLDEKTGYIRLVEFREDSAKEFHEGLAKLKEQGADSLILDLRNNPGGLLNVAIKITEEFLPKGEIIVSTKGRRPSQDVVTKSANTNPDFFDWPMVILINEGSASGSEILAGALKDNKRAVIVGNKSFGKGSVQSVIPLPDGSGLRLTTSKYFTPSGVSIHGKGIIPDVEVKRIIPKADTNDEKEKEIEKIFENVESHETEKPAEVKEENKGKEENKESKENKGKEDKKEDDVRKRLLSDNQIQTAISVIKGIKVYKSFLAPLTKNTSSEVSPTPSTPSKNSSN